MKRYIARHILMAKLAALALFTLCFAKLPVMAQQYSGNHVLYDIVIPSIGLAPGQSLGLTLFNPNDVPVRAQSFLTFSGFTGGVTVASGDINGGAFQYFNIKRSNIPLPGEAGTGRIQLSLSVRLSSSEAIKPVVASMEIIDIRDGTSNTVFVGEIPPSQSGGDGDDIIISGFGNDIMMGIVPGQTLRVTVSDPNLPDQSGRPTGYKALVCVFIADGKQIARSEEIAIPAGGFHSFNFDRNALPLAGEPGTGRLQLRATLFITRQQASLDRAPLFPSSLEIVDNSTGRTEYAADFTIIKALDAASPK